MTTIDGQKYSLGTIDTLQEFDHPNGPNAGVRLRYRVRQLGQIRLFEIEHCDLTQPTFFFFFFSIPEWGLLRSHPSKQKCYNWCNLWKPVFRKCQHWHHWRVRTVNVYLLRTNGFEIGLPPMCARQMGTKLRSNLDLERSFVWSLLLIEFFFFIYSK